MTISAYIPLFDALVRLLAPLVEIVVHDRESGTIHYINGGLSKRSVGDASLLERQELEHDLDKIVYPKLNFDGRLIKSISVPLKERWLICINCDVSVFSHMQTLSQHFLPISHTHQPKSLFKSDWQERLHVAIHSFLDQNTWAFEALSRSQKRQVVQHLYEQGAFHEKNAADYVAKVLNISRATVFNYLKEGKNK